MARQSSVACPVCDSLSTRVQTANKRTRPRRVAELNAVFRRYVCGDCGNDFGTVEAVLGGSVAEAIESEVLGFTPEKEEE